MNSLIILSRECVENKEAILTGDRARYAFDTHELRVGVSCKIAVLGGMRGEGLVVEASPDRVVMKLVLTLPPLDCKPVDLIVGVPRPQTVKKVIQASVMLGVRSVHFVRSELGERSYLQSHSLSEEGILDESIKALEQVWDSRLPDIRVHRTFSYFMENKVSQLGATTDASCLVAHPNGRELCASDGALMSREHVVAIGPERGWSESEVGLFRDYGFDVISLGTRVVRVEIAVVLTLGQLMLSKK